MPNGLNFTVGANTKPAEAALNKLGDALEVTGDKFAAIPRGAAQAAAGIDRLRKASNAATGTVINFGRVLQDAPFGFIGVANNINPLLEGFQRLRQESGSTGAAFKNLAKSIGGVGGLGLALSGFQFVALGGLAVLDKLFTSVERNTAEAKKNADALLVATEAQKKFREEISQAAASVLSQAKDVADLRDVLISTSTATVNLTKNTINLGVARLLFDQKNLAVQKLLSAEIEKQLILRKNADNRINFESTLPAFGKQKNPLGNLSDAQIRNALRAQGLQANDLQVRMVKVGQVVSDTQKEIKEINNLAPDLGNFFKGFVDGAAKAPKEVEKLLRVVKTSIRATPEETIPVVIEPEIIPRATAEQVTALSTLFKGFKVPVQIAPIIDIKAKDLADQIENILARGLSGFATGIGETISSVISGESNAFGAIVRTIGSLIEEIGRALIQYGIIKKGLDKILGPGGIAIPGGVALALGIAAVAIGSAFKNIDGFRAAGGPVGAGGSYIVGEKGPELFVPRTNGSIISNSDLNRSARGAGVGAMGAMAVVVTGSISGDVIKLQQARTTRRQSRIA